MLIASIVELGNDEVYYWTYALHLQYNYFDHPPMVGLLVRLTTANLVLHSELFVRLGAIICSAICTGLMFSIGKQVGNKRTGWWAALLYTTSIYTSIIAGTFILPDSPQMVFWLWGILLLIRIKHAQEQQRATMKLWIWFGIAAGLCTMSKVHGAFLWIAVGLYALFMNRKWLKQKGMYFAVIISLLIASPILIWNMQNGFITYNYHGNRVNLNGSGLHMDSFVRELLGSFFYNNPINVVLIFLGIAFSIKKQKGSADGKLLMLCGLPLICLLLGISLFRDTFPHWSGPGYTALIPLAAVYLDKKKSNDGMCVPKVIKAAFILIIFVLVAGIGIIKCYPGTIASATGDNLGDGDFTLDMYGWKELGKKMDSLNKAETAKGTMQNDAPIIVNKWFPAAHIDFYVAPVSHQATYAIGELFDLHHYYWLNAFKKPLQKKRDAYFIMPSNNHDEKYIGYYKERFDTVLPPSIIPIYRNGAVCKQVAVFRMKGYIGL